MAVVSVKLRRQRKSGSKLQIGRGIFRSGQRIYVVTVNSISDGPTVAEEAAGVPDLGDAWGVDAPTLYAAHKQSDTFGDSGMVFEVTVDYETYDPEDANSDPTARSQTVEFGPTEFVEDAYQAFEAPTAEDADGDAVDLTGSPSWKYKNAVCNSAGQTFDPSVPKAFYDQTCIITRNVSEFDWATAEAYQDTVNDANFTIKYKTKTFVIKKGQARVSHYGAIGRFENGTAYFEERIELQLRADGWVRKVLDQGLMELNNGDNPARPIRDADGQPIKVPVMLDGHGAQLANDAKPVFLKFKLYRGEMPFGSLNLNT